MLRAIYSILGRSTSYSPWHNVVPVREELFGLERLEEHAISLAKAQHVGDSVPRVLSLHKRLNDNATSLLASYRESAAQLEAGNSVVPAAEWLLDNYHLVEEQLREIRDDLPVGYYRQLPKLSSGPFAGYPRVFGLAWAFVAHTDSYIDPEILIHFIRAYQSVQPLTIGELWAVAITLRIVLIENLRRLADQIAVGRKARNDADQLTERLLVDGCAHSALQEDIASRSSTPLSEVFAAQLAKRLRDQDPKNTPTLDWLEQRLKSQGLSVEEAVQHAQQRQGASNVSIRNVITSMRLISDIDWSELFEKVSLVDQEFCRYSLFAKMDFPTRNLYRSAVEQLARGCDFSDIEIAQRAVQMAKESLNHDEQAEEAKHPEMDRIEKERLSDPGYYLIDQGRLDLEALLHYKPTWRLKIRRLHVRLGVAGYSGSIAVVALALLGGASLFPNFLTLSAIQWSFWVLIGFIPATEVAFAIVNRLVTWRFGAQILPGLELKLGVPSSLRTLIAVPTVLTCESDLLEQIERLEVHYLSGIDGDISFALLTDNVDADHETLENDAALLALAAKEIERLNARYPYGDSEGMSARAARFILLHRRRQFNPSEEVWMGWERKRGKLHELNRLLRGAKDTSFVAVNGIPPSVPSDVRYVITLDADTRLPRGAALRLVGKMAHPLNRPCLDLDKQRVVAGYGVLQPRVTPSLSIGSEGSFYQRVFSAPGGIDPYTAAISDVYQDLFEEGSFTGKGIYDVDIFEAALAGRVVDNTMLSHDLFEGIFVRAGLVSDIEVVEEFPARYDVAVKRQHRWTRGDWQLLPWIVAKQSNNQSITCLGRWKLLDNLRRSLVAPMTLLALVLCWLLPPLAALWVSCLLLASIAIPAFIPCCFSLIPHHSGVNTRNHLRLWLGDLRLALNQVFLCVAFLPDQSFRTLDAISRTLIRLWITHHHCLEWITAAHCNGTPRLRWLGFYRMMLGGCLLSLAVCGAALLVNPMVWLVITPFALLWCMAPILAFWVSRPPVIVIDDKLNGGTKSLRLTARRTWRYFETFVTPAENMLPPDNFQEDPEPMIAHRTSPTNIGLYLLSCAAARDFGWAGLVETIERLEATFASLDKLSKYKGHLFNWYDTQTLQSLSPDYISSVDSGNFAGHLIALANACDEWRDLSALNPIDADLSVRAGFMDNLELARAIVAVVSPLISASTVASATQGKEVEHPLRMAIDDIVEQFNSGTAISILSPILIRLSARTIQLVKEQSLGVIDGLLPERSEDFIFWMTAAQSVMVEQQRDKLEWLNSSDFMITRLNRLAQKARDMAQAMDFSFLIDPERKLLSIGFSLTENSLDPSCYDLLASEARLASLFAIAKGDVVTKHWFRLGRLATPLGNGSALISWSGSMFEYLMPSLIMRAPTGSLLEQTNRLIVQRQQDYGRLLGIPWGVSESAYNARDIEFTYQYSNFGVPGLGLKRGLAENTVIAPYATGLATMVDPKAAVLNYHRLQAMGAGGRFGFYEALDFTRSRLPVDSEVAIVRSFMAHHQGMTIVAIANTLHKGVFRQRFHQEPMIQACELLLQERMPRDVCMSHPRAEEVKTYAFNEPENTPKVRRLSATASGSPVTHLLSNGRYVVMLTATGAGYSRWRDIAVTRWLEDTTCDQFGSFIFLRDTHTEQLWSSTAHPLGGEDRYLSGVFEEDYAEFVRHDGSLTTTTNVLVSGEDDGEVRRVSLSNNGRGAREIELTSYSELVLTTPATDNAHPAFAKMFVQTQYLAEYGALIATRRKRTAQEPSIWAAHFAIVEGEVTADPQYETNRALFIGRGNSITTATAFEPTNTQQGRCDPTHPDLSSATLSNTVGTVLDPIFSLRYRVNVPAGKVVRVAFWTMVASSREALLALIDRHHDRSAYDRAKTLAWTQAQVQLRHLDISSVEAAGFQRIAAPILYADPRFRVAAKVIVRGIDCQSMLWTHSISGDLPIVLLRIDDVEDIDQVKQLLRAHEYWRMKRLAVDLVIINEHASSYIQELQVAIETAVRRSQSRPRFIDKFNIEHVKGAVHMLRTDLVEANIRDLLCAVARVVLIARRGPIAKQISRLAPVSNWHQSAPSFGQLTRMGRLARSNAMPPIKSMDGSAGPTSYVDPKVASLKNTLEFFNGLGGFGLGGREYTVILNNGALTPAPWINVIANPHFGFNVAAEGGGYTWSENSRENQLTPWCNDPVSNPSGEALYIRDEETLALFSVTAQPKLKSNTGAFIAHHGRGYSRFEHQVDGLALALLQFVPLADPIKISRLTLHNGSNRHRRLSITAYTEWVLGTSRSASGPFITTELDGESNTILVQNPWGVAFPGRVAFADMGGEQSSWTTDRSEFLGRHGNMNAPASLLSDNALSGTLGAGHDPCTAQQVVIGLAPNQSLDVVMFIGQCASKQEASDLVTRYRQADLDQMLDDVINYWDTLLGAVQVKTPERSMDIMLNGWLLYQTVACRMWARSGFYQASGAYGFRDQLQDGLSLTFRRPDLTRAHILRAAGRQFVAGDVQHWWLPHSGQGVRTHISDDRVWLTFATASYIQTSGDVSILDEEISFIDGPLLEDDQHDAYFQAMVSDESASLLEHCARGLDQCLALTGINGLPLMGTGDWNDGMNRVGEGGQGESVWLGWLLIRTIDLFVPLLKEKGERGRKQRWVAHASKIRQAIEEKAWDGQWYRRASFDDGSWLGSKENDECQIDSIAQSWAVLSQAANPERAAQAMAAIEQWLIQPKQKLALLFTPPFDKTTHDPGYIKGYPPGLRENGGQYSHAAMWAILAYTKLGDGNKAFDLFHLLNPINHALNAEDAECYKVEPYVVAADVYSVAPHVGRGGWTWYSGASGWMYQAGMEGILGIHREGNELTIQPCIPSHWPGFEATVKVQASDYAITVNQLPHNGEKNMTAILDGMTIQPLNRIIRVPLDGKNHKLMITI
ncbi:GH36-type glycosyl hydrolase domain-containing protein [Celerinatantimonas yamalensis]|uniref:Glucoamylase family protein n=1 Tax=Celerinatantimonas yamalensis TaxID=559956 RepID=A0ABW9G934_9GAMM